MKKPIIGLNGPPECGKTYIMGKLHSLLPHATPIKIQHSLFEMCVGQDPSLAKFATYEDYKASDYFNRRFVIDVATHARDNYGDDVFVKHCENMKSFRDADIVIFDNIGLTGDHIWAREIGAPYLLVRLETPYNQKEPGKSLMQSLPGTPWMNDSRQPFDHEHMLSAYDSQQMSLLLDWLVDGKNDKESGPYHEYHQLWRQHFAAS